MWSLKVVVTFVSLWGDVVTTEIRVADQISTRTHCAITGNYHAYRLSLAWRAGAMGEHGNWMKKLILKPTCSYREIWITGKPA